ncbi:MAG TPA: recombinase family protein [Anaerolineae bacterium]|nr:recombinase family protein [Anaerolineae bacterium]
MKESIFLEREAEHARRLGLSERRTGMLRRTLALKREGYTPRRIRVQMGKANVTWRVALRTPEELEQELGVAWEGGVYVPDSPAVSADQARAVAEAGRAQARGSNKHLRAQYGLHNGSTAPYGYTFGPDITVKTTDGQSLTGHSLVPDPDTSVVVADIFAQFIGGASPYAIAADLNRRGISSPSGGRWGEANVRDIVRRAPLYSGYVVYHDVAHKQARWTGMLYPGQHEALIDWETTLAVLTVTGRTLEWTFGPTREAQTAATEVA